MARKQVRVSRDHIQRQAQASPLAAIEELIWNGLDSGGTQVEVRFVENKLGGLECIQVIDNGNGINPSDLDTTFGTVGNSQKLKQESTIDGRILHGKEGRGRFKALALGRRAIWATTYKNNGGLLTYDISVDRDDPEYFDPTEPVAKGKGNTGTIVRITDVDRDENALRSESARERLAARFAIYLSNYRKIKIVYDGHVIDISRLVAQSTDYSIDASLPERKHAVLTVIEWNIRLSGKLLYFCDQDGFVWDEQKAGVQAPGIEYAAYLRSEDVQEWHKTGQFALGELDGGINDLVKTAKDILRAHVRNRLAEEAQDVVEQWKREEIYPYSETESHDPLKEAERQVFDIVAVRVNDHHEGFRTGEADSRKLTLALIKQALESNPSSLTTILEDVIKLPAEDQDAFADLLKRTPLSSLIKAGRIVAERLDTIQAFDRILFDPNWKEQLLERTQLHRLLVHELWFFGEEYALGTDDESLGEVLKKHLKYLNREDISPDVDVKTILDKEGIPDLMLYRKYPNHREQFEHLVIELKRPKEKLGVEETTQIKTYAFSVVKDERFNTSKCRWNFVLLGNDLDEFASQEVGSGDLPPDCLYKKGNVTIWVKRWADVFAEIRMRYEFFRERLNLEAKGDNGMKRLYARYPHLLEGRGKRKAADLAITAARLGAPASQPPNPV